jgi:aspartate-semialdehyde dehydrogenase
MRLRDKIPVGVLGATGAVGQRFVQLLTEHPWFEVAALAASERSVSKRYQDAANWVIPGDPPDGVGDLVVQPLTPNLPVKLVFSAVPSSVARKVEPEFAQAGYAVCSNASAFRAVEDVPLLIPEVNASHLAMIAKQRENRGWSGFIVTSPNCTITGVVMALKPLHEVYQVRKVFMASMQAVSGAGYPGVASLDIMDNVIPYVAGEEEKFQQELSKMLGVVVDGSCTYADVILSAHANRVPVVDGHTVSISAGFAKKPTVEDALALMREYRGDAVCSKLPSAPPHPLVVTMLPDRPQPRRDRDAESGMAVTVGRVRLCPILDLRMTTVTHNTLRGAASGAVMNAELLVEEGYVT